MSDDSLETVMRAAGRAMRDMSVTERLAFIQRAADRMTTEGTEEARRLTAAFGEHEETKPK